MNSFQQREQLYKSLSYEPFQLDFKLRSPIVHSDRPILLDGLLMYIVSKELKGVQAFDDAEQVYTDIPLPLQKTDTYYHASIGIASQFVRGVTELTKQWTGITTVKRDSGWSRAYLERIPYIMTPAITFYGFGNIEEVKRLAGKVTHIGKNHRMGFGSIREIKITPILQDLSILSEDGNLQRPVPIDSWNATIPNKSYVTVMPIQPPYWSNKNLALVYCPLPDSWLQREIQVEPSDMDTNEPTPWYMEDNL